MTLARVSVVLAALLFAGVGVWFLADPLGAGGLVGIELTNATAVVDFRATYGGFNLGLGAAMLLFARLDVRAGLLVQMFAAAGYGGGRALGLALAEGPVDPMLYGLLGTEVAMLALGWVAWRRLG